MVWIDAVSQNSHKFLGQKPLVAWSTCPWLQFFFISVSQSRCKFGSYLASEIKEIKEGHHQKLQCCSAPINNGYYSSIYVSECHCMQVFM